MRAAEEHAAAVAKIAEEHATALVEKEFEAMAQIEDAVEAVN